MSSDKMVRSNRACLNCRRHKMKCENNDEPPCKRCKATGKSCIFAARANAAIGPDNAGWAEQVEIRLYDVEMELRTLRNSIKRSPEDESGSEEIEEEDSKMDESGRNESSARTAQPSSAKRRRMISTEDSIEPVPLARGEAENTGQHWAQLISRTAAHLTSDWFNLSKVLLEIPSQYQLRGVPEEACWNATTIHKLWLHFQSRHATSASIVHASNTYLTPLLAIAGLLIAAHDMDVTSGSTCDPGAFKSLFETVWTQKTSLWKVTSQTPSPTGSKRSPGLVRDRETFSDVLAVVLVCEKLVEEPLTLSGSIATAQRMVLDNLGQMDATATVNRSEWTWLWDRLMSLSQQVSLTRLSVPIVQPTPLMAPDLPPLEENLDIERVTSMQDILRQFACRGLTSIHEFVWSGPSSTEKDKFQLDESEITTLRHFIRQLESDLSKAQQEGCDQDQQLERLMTICVFQSIKALNQPEPLLTASMPSDRRDYPLEDEDGFIGVMKRILERLVQIKRRYTSFENLMIAFAIIRLMERERDQSDVISNGHLIVCSIEQLGQAQHHPYTDKSLFSRILERKDEILGQAFAGHLTTTTTSRPLPPSGMTSTDLFDPSSMLGGSTNHRESGSTMMGGAYPTPRKSSAMDVPGHQGVHHHPHQPISPFHMASSWASEPSHHLLASQPAVYHQGHVDAHIHTRNTAILESSTGSTTGQTPISDFTMSNLHLPPFNIDPPPNNYQHHSPMGAFNTGASPMGEGGAFEQGHDQIGGSSAEAWPPVFMSWLGQSHDSFHSLPV